MCRLGYFNRSLVLSSGLSTCHARAAGRPAFPLLGQPELSLSAPELGHEISPQLSRVYLSAAALSPHSMDIHVSPVLAGGQRRFPELSGRLSGRGGTFWEADPVEDLDRFSHRRRPLASTRLCVSGGASERPTYTSSLRACGRKWINLLRWSLQRPSKSGRLRQAGCSASSKQLQWPTLWPRLLILQSVPVGSRTTSFRMTYS